MILLLSKIFCLKVLKKPAIFKKLKETVPHKSQPNKYLNLMESDGALTDKLGQTDIILPFCVNRTHVPLMNCLLTDVVSISLVVVAMSACG